jgi:hypothetical protein
MSQKDPEERKAYNRQYYQEHKQELLPKIRKRVKEWQSNNRDHCNEQQREYRKQNATPWREATKRYRAKLKADGVAAYGGCCSCCGEIELEFLTLDHVDGGGGAHRKLLKRQGRMGGGAPWLIAKQEGYPPTYRVLCSNCNTSAAQGGGVCVHQRKKNEITH